MKLLRIGFALLGSCCLEHAQAQTPPSVSSAYSMTMPPWVLSKTSALLRGAASANDVSAMVWFEWGTNFTMSITSAPIMITNFNFNLVTNAVTDLTPGITYSCRLVVSNSGGISYGAEKRFTTGMRMLAWGQNDTSFYYTGLTNIPPGLSNIVGCSAGEAHFAALRDDGTVAAWGTTAPTGYPVAPPPDATNVVAVCAKTYHNLGLRIDGTLVPWGDTSYNLNQVPARDTNIVAIGCGTQHNVVLRSDGTVDCWGRPAATNNPIPSSASNCVDVAGGGDHNLALRLDGTVIAWGNNNVGQTNVPIGLTNVIAIAAGVGHSLALRADGTVLAWGGNAFGVTNVPADATNIIAVTADGWSSCGLRKDGALVYWGDNVVQQGAIPGLAVAAVDIGYINTLVLGPNLPPSATQKSATTYPNADVQIQLAGTDPNGDPFTLNITSLPANGALFQNQSGARGARIVTVPTAPTDSHNWITYAATNAIGSDSFTVAVSNDQFTSSAAYTVNIVLPAAPGFLIPQSGSFSNNQFHLEFSGTVLAGYNVWSSTNLQDWVLLGPATLQPNNLFNFWDTGTGAAQRFYRATAP